MVWIDSELIISTKIIYTVIYVYNIHLYIDRYMHTFLLNLQYPNDRRNDITIDITLHRVSPLGGLKAPTSPQRNRLHQETHAQSVPRELQPPDATSRTHHQTRRVLDKPGCVCCYETPVSPLS